MVRRVLCLMIVRDGFAEGLDLGRGVPCSRLRLNFRRAVYIVRPRVEQRLLLSLVKPPFSHGHTFRFTALTRVERPGDLEIVALRGHKNTRNPANKYVTEALGVLYGGGTGRARREKRAALGAVWKVMEGEEGGEEAENTGSEAEEGGGV